MPEPALPATTETVSATDERTSLHDALAALRHAAARARALDEAARAIAGVLDPDAVLQLIVDRVRDLAEAEYAALGTVDAEGQIDRSTNAAVVQRAGGHGRSCAVARHYAPARAPKPRISSGSRVLEALVEGSRQAAARDLS